jgi:hypothetical protein
VGHQITCEIDFWVENFIERYIVKFIVELCKDFSKDGEEFHRGAHGILLKEIPLWMKMLLVEEGMLPLNPIGMKK